MTTLRRNPSKLVGRYSTSSSGSEYEEKKLIISEDHQCKKTQLLGKKEKIDPRLCDTNGVPEVRSQGSFRVEIGTSTSTANLLDQVRVFQIQDKVEVKKLVVGRKLVLGRKSKRKLHDYLKTLSVLCDLCDDSKTERVIKLNGHERVLAGFILKKGLLLGIRKKRIFPSKFPEQLCGSCFTNIYIFRNRLKHRSIEKLKIQNQPREKMDQSEHGYHCQCPTCQNQYGSLPLLLRGIEEQNRIESAIGHQVEESREEKQALYQLTSRSQVEDTLQHSREAETMFQQEVRSFESQKYSRLEVTYQREEESGLSHRQLEDNFFQPCAKSEDSFQQRSFSHESQNQLDVTYQLDQESSESHKQLEASFHQEQDIFESHVKEEDSFQQGSFSHESQNQLGVTHQLDQETSESHKQLEASFHREHDIFELHIKKEDSLQERSFSNESQVQLSEQLQPDIINLFGYSVRSAEAQEESSKDDENLPTLLKDIEAQSSSQPSTSGTQCHFQGQEDKKSRKTLTCTHCDKIFTHKGDFNKHLRKHTKERPFECSFCGKKFSHTSNLHRHQRIHSGDRPFKCDICNKSFNRKDKLDSHRNSKFCKSKRS